MASRHGLFEQSAEHSSFAAAGARPEDRRSSCADHDRRFRHKPFTDISSASSCGSDTDITRPEAAQLGPGDADLNLLCSLKENSIHTHTQQQWCELMKTPMSNGLPAWLSPEFMAEHAAKALDFDSDVLLVPVRHSSMAVSLHLPRIIEAYRPDLVAMEFGPALKEHFKDLTHPELKPPVAIVMSSDVGAACYRNLSPVAESAGGASGSSSGSSDGASSSASDNSSPGSSESPSASGRALQTEHCSCNSSVTGSDDNSSEMSEMSEMKVIGSYPVLSCSPEYTMLVEARRRNIDIELIDLDADEMLWLEERYGGAGSIDGYARAAHGGSVFDAVSSLEFSRVLLNADGSHERSLFWNKRFEANALGMSSMQYLHEFYIHLYSLYRFARDEISSVVIQQRERNMLAHIARARRTHKRIMVLTGGFHTISLCDCLHFNKPAAAPVFIPSFRKKACIIPYSFDYAHKCGQSGPGIEFPYYYHRLHQAITSTTAFYPRPHISHDVLASTSSCTSTTGCATAAPAAPVNHEDPAAPAAQSHLPVVQARPLAGAADSTAAQVCGEREGAVPEGAVPECAVPEGTAERRVHHTKPSARQRDAWLHYRADIREIERAVRSVNFHFMSAIRDERGDEVGVATLLECEKIMRGLAALRGLTVPSVYDLIDAVISTFIKEELTEDNAVVKNTMAALNALHMGSVPSDIRVPALWRDFMQQAVRFGISLKDKHEHAAQIDICAGREQLLFSQFIARSGFIAPSFLTSFPQMRSRSGTVSSYEQVSWSFNEDAIRTLIGLSHTGSSVEHACITRISGQLEHYTHDIRQLCALFISSLNMGLTEHFMSHKDRIAQLISESSCISDIGESLDELNSYSVLVKTGICGSDSWQYLIDALLRRYLAVLGETGMVAWESRQDFIACALRIDWYFSRNEHLYDEYLRALETVVSDSRLRPFITGTALALLQINGHLKVQLNGQLNDRCLRESSGHMTLSIADAVSDACLREELLYAPAHIAMTSAYHRDGLNMLINDLSQVLS